MPPGLAFAALLPYRRRIFVLAVVFVAEEEDDETDLMYACPSALNFHHVFSALHVSACSWESSVSTIAQAIKQLQRGAPRGARGTSSRHGYGGSDAWTRALLAAKGYTHAAGLGGAGQHGTGAGAQNGFSGRASPSEGAGFVPSVPGAEWDGGGCADLIGRSRNGNQAAGGDGADGGWVL